MLITKLLTLMVAFVQTPSDIKTTDLADGYVRVKTPGYTIEVPKGWNVSPQTPWGQRKVEPEKGSGELGVMTAPPTKQSWDQLYQTALYFIQREEKGKPTPYRITRTKTKLEAASFEVLNAEGFPSRRFVMIREESKGLLALSVKVLSKEADKQWSKHFQRLVDTARFTE